MEQKTEIHGVYKAGLILAIAPLVVGLIIQVLLLALRSETFVTVALYAFTPCVISVVMSFLCLLAFLFWDKNQIGARVVPALKLLGLILLAPAIVFTTAVAGFQVASLYFLTIENNSQSAVTDIVVRTNSLTDDVPVLAPRQRVKRSYDFHSDGSMTFTAFALGQKITGTLEGYVGRGMGGSGRLEFTENGKWKFTSTASED